MLAFKNKNEVKNPCTGEVILLVGALYSLDVLQSVCDEVGVDHIEGTMIMANDGDERWTINDIFDKLDK